MVQAKTSPRKTKSKRTLTRATFREDISRMATVSKVDRERGVIFGVKVCGNISENGREYPPEVRKAALALYEGVKVNIDHPAAANDQRIADDRFGRLVNVRWEPDGTYADLEYLKSHPLAERICEAAERMPGAFGLSHNAEGDTDYVNGVCVVRKILEVRSVDIVADPATTNGLFEGRNVGKTFREVLSESIAKLSKVRQSWGRRLLEMDDMAPALDAEVPAEEPASPDDALAAGFESAALAIVQAVLGGDMDAAAGIGKLKELLVAHGKLTAAEEPAEPTAEAEGETPADDKKDDDKETKESIAAKAVATYRKLVEALGFVPTSAQEKALAAVEGKERDELIESFKGLSAASKTEKPRSRTASGEEKPNVSTDRAVWLESLRNN